MRRSNALQWKNIHPRGAGRGSALLPRVEPEGRRRKLLFQALCLSLETVSFLLFCLQGEAVSTDTDFCGEKCMGGKTVHALGCVLEEYTAWLLTYCTNHHCIIGEQYVVGVDSKPALPPLDI